MYRRPAYVLRKAGRSERHGAFDAVQCPVEGWRAGSDRSTAITGVRATSRIVAPQGCPRSSESANTSSNTRVAGAIQKL